MKSTRPASLTIAAILLALGSLANFATPLVPGPPPLIVALSIGTGILGLGAAEGLWQAKLWAMVLTIILMVINALSAAPGMFIQPNEVATIGSAVGVITSALIIVLVLLPSARQAYSLNTRAEGALGGAPGTM